MISDVNKKHAHIPIRVHGISDGDYDYDFDVDPKEIELPEQFVRPFHVRAEVEKTGEQSIINVTVDITGTFPCDRCLTDLQIPMHQQFTLMYVKEDDTAQVTAPDEEPREVDPAEPVIDIAPDVADVIQVGVPMRKVCEEYNPENAHCEDMVKERDHDNTKKGDDPRWDALKNLKLDD